MRDRHFPRTWPRMLAGAAMALSLGAQAPEPAAPPAPIPAVNPAPEPALAVNPAPMLARNTPVVVELLTEISTEKVLPDDFFDLVVAEEVRVGTVVAIPAKAKVKGQIVDSKAAGVFGAPAKLLLAIRYVDTEGGRIPLKFFQPTAGEDRSNAAMHLTFLVGPFAAFMRAGQIALPAGTRLIAKVAKDTPLPAPAVIPQVPPTPPALEPADSPKGITP